MLEFLDNDVIVPYVKQTRSELQLASDQPALALFDVFEAHHCESVLEKLCESYSSSVCTSRMYRAVSATEAKKSHFKDSLMNSMPELVIEKLGGH